MARDRQLLAIVVDELADGVVDADRLAHSDPAFEAGAAAFGAANGFVHRRAVPQAQRGNHRRVGRLGLAASRAKPPHQPLRQHRAQRRGQQERLDPHVAQTCDRARRVVGVDGRKHEVPRQRGLHRDLGCLAVADFADHDDVGILPQDRAQSGCESQPDLGVDLRLPDPVHGIFHRVFHSQDVARAVVEQL